MDLKELRDQINQVDQQICEQFVNRMELAVKIAAYKAEHDIPVYDPIREEEVLTRVENLVPEAFAMYTRSLFETLFSLSRTYQQSLGAK